MRLRISQPCKFVKEAALEEGAGWSLPSDGMAAGSGRAGLADGDERFQNLGDPAAARADKTGDELLGGGALLSAFAGNILIPNARAASSEIAAQLRPAWGIQ